MVVIVEALSVTMVDTLYFMLYSSIVFLTVFAIFLDVLGDSKVVVFNTGVCKRVCL